MIFIVLTVAEKAYPVSVKSANFMENSIGRSFGAVVVKQK
jgi:hypothetical protein